MNDFFDEVFAAFMVLSIGRLFWIAVAVVFGVL